MQAGAGDLLKPDGVALVHSIGRSDGPGVMNAWVDKYLIGLVLAYLALLLGFTWLTPHEGAYVHHAFSQEKGLIDWVLMQKLVLFFVLYRASPAITSAPLQATHGTRIAVATDSAAASFSLVRLSSVTHSTNNDQRRVPLAFSAQGGNSYELTIPSNPGIVPDPADTSSMAAQRSSSVEPRGKNRSAPTSAAYGRDGGGAVYGSPGIGPAMASPMA